MEFIGGIVFFIFCWIMMILSDKERDAEREKEKLQQQIKKNEADRVFYKAQGAIEAKRQNEIDNLLNIFSYNDFQHLEHLENKIIHMLSENNGDRRELFELFVDANINEFSEIISNRMGWNSDKILDSKVFVSKLKRSLSEHLYHEFRFKVSEKNYEYMIAFKNWILMVEKKLKNDVI